MTAGRAGPLVVVGDALLDRDVIGQARRLCPDAPVPVVDGVTEYTRPGGAGLAALLAARDGQDVVLVTALADDDAGRTLRGLLSAELEVVATTWSGPTPQKVRIRAGDHPLVRVDYGDGYAEVGPATAAMRRAVAGAGAILVADYGRGVAADPGLRSAIAEQVDAVPVVWDPHPRGVPPVPGVTVATPNLAEARHFAAAGTWAGAVAGAVTGAEAPVEPAWGPGRAGASGPDAEARHYAALLRAAWCANAIVVTLGAVGALLDAGGRQPVMAPTAGPSNGDPCGAGDRFSAAVAGQLLVRASLPDAVNRAVAVAARYVAAGGPATLRDTALRSRTVTPTGGR